MGGYTGSCGSVDFGEYSAMVDVVTPTGKRINIDKCIYSEIEGLWENGITTIECCCGHNKTSSYVAVVEKDMPKMVAMGYVKHKNHHLPNIYHTKTSRHSVGDPEKR